LTLVLDRGKEDGGESVYNQVTNNKDFTLATLLEDYHWCGFLKNRAHPFHKSVIGCPTTVAATNKTLAGYYLEFMDNVMTEDDVNFLKGNYTDFTAASRLNLYNSIQNKAMDKLWIWEGNDPGLEKAQVGKTAGAKPKPNFTGFGTRVKEYKKKYLERTNQQQEKPNYKTVPLVHPSDSKGH